MSKPTTDVLEREIRLRRQHAEFGHAWIWIASKNGYKCLVCGMMGYCPECVERMPEGAIIRSCFQHGTRRG
jgi:hypothetical protein